MSAAQFFKRAIHGGARQVLSSRILPPLTPRTGRSTKVRQTGFERNDPHNSPTDHPNKHARRQSLKGASVLQPYQAVLSKTQQPATATLSLHTAKAPH